MFIYPWGDMHSLNLGWFLLQFKEWVEKIQEYLDNGGGTSENLANVIAPVFNAENSYLTGDYVLYNDELYKALEPVPPGTWNPDAWERCLVTEEMGSSASGVDNVARLMIAGQYSNTYNYQKYAICRYTDKLWMCNTNLPAGGEEWEPSHWDEITVGAGLTGLRRSVETLSEDIVTLNGAINDVQGQICAYVETGDNASRAYGAGGYVVWKGDLYKVKAFISSGAAFTVGTNLEAATITNDIKQFSGSGTLNTTLFESGSANYIRSGKLVIIQIADLKVKSDATTAHNDNVFTGLPAIASPLIFLVWSSNSTASTSFRLKVDGTNLKIHYATPIVNIQYYGMVAYLTTTT